MDWVAVRTQQPLPMEPEPHSANTDCTDDPLDQPFPACAIWHDGSETKPANETENKNVINLVEY